MLVFIGEGIHTRPRNYKTAKYRLSLNAEQTRRQATPKVCFCWHEEMGCLHLLVKAVLIFQKCFDYNSIERSSKHNLLAACARVCVCAGACLPVAPLWWVLYETATYFDYYYNHVSLTVKCDISERCCSTLTHIQAKDTGLRTTAKELVLGFFFP